MADIDLSQKEADALIAMEKHRVDERTWNYPAAVGGAISIPLISADRQETFALDVSRGRIDLRKGTYQNRARQVIVLVRLDFGGAPHRNPDGEEVPCPHLHVYREGYADKYAVVVPTDAFRNVEDPWQALQDFMRYCNITKSPAIERGLWG